MPAVVTDHVSRNDNSGGYGALALLIERNPLPSLLFDPQWLNVLAANAAARDQYGYDAAEWLRLTMTDIVCDDDLPAFLRSIEPKVRDPRRVQRWQHRCRDGSLIEVDCQTDALQYEGRTALLAVARRVDDGASVDGGEVTDRVVTAHSNGAALSERGRPRRRRPAGHAAANPE